MHTLYIAMPMKLYIIIGINIHNTIKYSIV